MHAAKKIKKHTLGETLQMTIEEKKISFLNKYFVVWNKDQNIK